MTYEQMREETSRLLDTPWGDLKDGYEKEKRIEKLRQNWNMRKAKGVATTTMGVRASAAVGGRVQLDGDIAWMK